MMLAAALASLAANAWAQRPPSDAMSDERRVHHREWIGSRSMPETPLRPPKGRSVCFAWPGRSWSELPSRRIAEQPSSD